METVGVVEKHYGTFRKINCWKSKAGTPLISIRALGRKKLHLKQITDIVHISVISCYELRKWAFKNVTSSGGKVHQGILFL